MLTEVNMENDYKTSPYRILIVEDEPELRSLYYDYLTSLGFDVIAIGKGSEALFALQRVRPHIVLLDIRLGNISGLDILPILVQNDPKVSVIMITSVSEEGIGREALRRGASDYFVKPVNLKDLYQSIQHKLAVYTANNWE